MYHDRINVSEGTDVSNTTTSKDYIICCYWYFLNKGFKFQSCVCNDCQLIMSIEFNSIAIINAHRVNYRCIVVVISNNEAIN